MASAQGFVDGSLDYRHMYRIPDLQGDIPAPVVQKDTVMEGVLSASPRWFELVSRTQLAGEFNNALGSFTVFVPVQVPDTYFYADDYLLFRKALAHTLPKPYPMEFITGSRSMLVRTRQTGTSILIESSPQGTVVNHYSKVIGFQKSGNSLIVLLDRPIYTDGANPMAVPSW